jgi:hypothetical protein
MSVVMSTSFHVRVSNRTAEAMRPFRLLRTLAGSRRRVKASGNKAAEDAGDSDRTLSLPKFLDTDTRWQRTPRACALDSGGTL